MLCGKVDFSVLIRGESPEMLGCFPALPPEKVWLQPHVSVPVALLWMGLKHLVSELRQNITGRNMSWFCISLFVSYLTKRNRKRLGEASLRLKLSQNKECKCGEVSKQGDSELSGVISPLL